MSKQRNLDEIQAPSAEELYAEELAFLEAWDTAVRPPGWSLSPEAVIAFVCGVGKALEAPEGVKWPKGMARRCDISRKFIGARALIERCVVTLAGERGLLLVGEPGTAKSMLSELLAAAISGTSQLTIQGSAGTTEEQLRYSWNYGLLLAKGPCREALVSTPVLRAMQQGKLVRIEEITRCLPEVQDALISILSERRLQIPELGHDGNEAGRPGFNVIATANLRDQGVSEMSAALKRRFNFEVIEPIAEFEREVDLVRRQAAQLLERSAVNASLDDGVLEALVTAFRDLRNGQSIEGWHVERPSTVMSTAECVTLATAMARQSAFFPSQKDPVSSLPGHLLGVVLKDETDDRGKLLAYWDSVVKRRAESGSRIWQRLNELRKSLESNHD